MSDEKTAQPAPPAPEPLPQPAPSDQHPATQAAPVAWQPLSFGGVAAFAQARVWRVLVLQFIFATLVAASIVWFLARCYAPVISEAVAKMPDGASITNGQLTGVPAPLISGTTFLSIGVTTDDDADLGQTSDLQIELRKSGTVISSFLHSALGSLEMDYPSDSTLDLSRAHLEPLWGAYKPVVLTETGLGVVIVLFAIWSLLALLYSPAAKFSAWFFDRHLTWTGAWRLSGASLMPGAALMALGVLLYGCQLIDLIGLSYFTIVHFLVGWVYVVVAPAFAPRLAPKRVQRNPFKV